VCHHCGGGVSVFSFFCSFSIPPGNVTPGSGKSNQTKGPADIFLCSSLSQFPPKEWPTSRLRVTKVGGLQFSQLAGVWREMGVNTLGCSLAKPGRGPLPPACGGVGGVQRGHPLGCPLAKPGQVPLPPACGGVGGVQRGHPLGSPLAKPDRPKFPPQEPTPHRSAIGSVGRSGRRLCPHPGPRVYSILGTFFNSSDKSHTGVT